VTKSLAELESETAAFHTAKANAVAEIKRLQDRREPLLLTASIDEILKIDDEIRRQEIAGEIAQAKADALREDLYWARENAKRYAGVSMPSDDELERLLAIVTEDVDMPRLTNPSREILDEFRRAFYSVARLGRLPEPDAGRYFVSSLDDANETLRAQRLQGIEGDTMLAAAIAWGDVVWRAPDKAVGQWQEIGLARLNQGAPARPVWREILACRADVLAPLAPRGMRSSATSYPTRPVRILEQGADGQMHEAAPIAPLLVQ
jgi:hypothetical protein